MRCAKCGSDNRDGRKFCSKCSVALGRQCPRCGASNEAAANAASAGASSPQAASTASNIRVAPEQPKADSIGTAQFLLLVNYRPERHIGAWAPAAAGRGVHLRDRVRIQACADAGYNRSDNVAKAVEYLGRAAQQALQRSAYTDAISGLRRR
jgi:predicted amidophosphoribosyltransferase